MTRDDAREVTDAEGGEGRPRPIGRAVAIVAVALAAGAGIALSRLWPSGKKEGPRAIPAGPRTTGFEDVAEKAGIRFRMAFLPNEQGQRFKINLYDHGCGVAVGDFDGDGLDDIYFCNQLGPNALYRNEGDGRFTDVTEKAGVAVADRISVAAVFADYDDDGHQDLFVTTTRGGNVLFHNRGDGTFEDVTKKAGLDLVAHSETPTFFDADGDGFPDLLVTNTAKWTTDALDPAGHYYVGPASLVDLVGSPKEHNRFYRNRGDGTFADATEESGLAGVGWGGDVAVFDYDGDGDLDVFVANMFGRSVLYANDGRGHFRDVTSETLGRTSWGTVGARAFDYDGDGRLDLYLVDMHSDMWMPPEFDPASPSAKLKHAGPLGPDPDKNKMKEFAERLGVNFDDVVFGNTLFHNLGDGRFEEVSDPAGAETFWPWGIAAGDFDGDGFEDAFVPSGMGYPFAYSHSPLLMNNRNGTFTDRSQEEGLDPPPGGRYLPEGIGGKQASRSSRSAATADFDGDGRLDMVVNNFNDVPFLLMNRWPRRNYVALRLTGEFRGTGRRSPRDAIGALVRLTVGGRTLVRQVQAAGGYLAQSSNTLHFGLGDATKIDRCEIRWPSGRVQTIEGLEPNRLHAIQEPAR